MSFPTPSLQNFSYHTSYSLFFAHPHSLSLPGLCLFIRYSGIISRSPSQSLTSLCVFHAPTRLGWLLLLYAPWQGELNGEGASQDSMRRKEVSNEVHSSIKLYIYLENNDGPKQRCSTLPAGQSHLGAFRGRNVLLGLIPDYVKVG